MIYYKIKYHIFSLFKVWWYKIIFLGKIKTGKNLQFRKGFCLMIDTGMFVVGDNVFFNHYCSVGIMNLVTIGDGTIFGENVKIYDHNHIYSNPDKLIKYQGYTSAPILIGKHCWIGSNVTILKGVTIGDNSVIGAGCVIYKDIPNNSIVINKQDFEIKIIKKGYECNVCQ